MNRFLAPSMFSAALAGGCAAPAPAAVDSGPAATAQQTGAPSEFPLVPGVAAPGHQWRRTEVARWCEEPARASAHPRQIELPDSAKAVAVARRALGALADEHLEVSRLVNTGNGVFIHFADRRAGVLDGTASVYVWPGPCVALLGW